MRVRHALTRDALRRLLLFLPLAIWTACDAPGEERFALIATSVAGGALERDEPIGLRFSRALAPRTATSSLALVDAHSGETVPFQARVDGHHLWLTPRHPSGLWPAETALTLRLPHPPLGLPLRSRGGLAPADGWSDRFVVQGGGAERPLALVSSDLDSDLLSGAEHYRVGEEPRPLELTFDGPVDERSLATGLQLLSLDRRVRLDVEARRDPGDWRVVHLLPYDRTGKEVYRSGERYQVRVTRHLRSVDGRAARGGRRLSFLARGNGAVGPRRLTIDFAEARDLDPESVPHADLSGGALVPQVRTEAVLCGVGGEEVQLGSGEVQVRPFGFSGARFQILVPPGLLGLEPRLIKRIAFRTVWPTPEGTRIRDLEVAVAHASFGQEGLERDLDVNLASGRDARRLALSGGVRTLVLGRDDGFSNSDIPAVVIPFEEAFEYAGDGRGLIIDIAHGGIEAPVDLSARPDGARFARDGIRLVGNPAPGGMPSLALATPEAPRGQILPFLPGLALETWFYPPIVSRWHVVENMAAGGFFQAGRDLSLSGLDPTEVELAFQAGEPILDARGTPRFDALGRARCEPEGDPLIWRPRPASRGARAVRIRLRIAPRVALRAERGPRPEILYVFLRYRERESALPAPSER